MSALAPGHWARSWPWRIAALGVILLALLLRLHGLTGPSLRGDEAFSVTFAAQSLPSMVSTLLTVETQPPLYYAGLHGWMLLAGQSELAVRFVSVFFGMLLVPVMWRLGAMLTGAPAGALAAGALAAINPYQVWQSQDARMYTLLMVTCATALLLALAIWGRQDAGKAPGRLWPAYILAALIALYSHYGAAFALLAINAGWLAFVLVRRVGGGSSIGLPAAGRWLAAQLLVGLGFLPWLVPAAPLLSGHVKGFIVPVAVGELAERAAVTYSLGATGGTAAAWGTFAFAVTALAGLWRGWRVHPAKAAAVVVCSSAPLLAALLVSLNRPIFEERYFIFVSAAWLLMAAWGLEGCVSAAVAAAGRLRRPALVVGLVLSALVLSSTAASLWNLYFSPNYAKSPGWREAVQFIYGRALPGDLVIQNSPDPSLPYYLAGKVDHTVQPTSTPLIANKAEQDLASAVAGRRRVWFLPDDNPNWDGQGFVQTWLEGHARRTLDTSVGGLPIQLYEMVGP